MSYFRHWNIHVRSKAGIKLLANHFIHTGRMLFPVTDWFSSLEAIKIRTQWKQYCIKLAPTLWAGWYLDCIFHAELSDWNLFVNDNLSTNNCQRFSSKRAIFKMNFFYEKASNDHPKQLQQSFKKNANNYNNSFV